jgi:putative transposase
LQQILKDLDRAWGDFFLKKKGMPRFKKKGMHDSFRYPQGCKFKGHKLFVPKIGWIKFRKSRSIEGVVKNVTVSRRAGEWYVSVQTEEEVETPIHPHETIELGIDMGVARLATLSNGLVLEPCRAYRSSQRLLGKAQADLSRKKRRSNNRRKQILRLQRLHKRAADIRRDYLHKATTWIAKNHGKVMLEDLQVAKMSARGTVENPGSSVSVKARLNQGILDQGWHEFRRQLSYKLEWLGGTLILVDPKYTSQCCPVCGYTSSENRKTQKTFICLRCGHTDHADFVASQNIRTAGQAGMACESSGISLRKQEPLGTGTPQGE